MPYNSSQTFYALEVTLIFILLVYACHQYSKGKCFNLYFFPSWIFDIRCRKGSAEILVNFDDLYPPEIMSDNKEKGISENATNILGSFQICGKHVPRGYWVGNFYLQFPTVLYLKYCYLMLFQGDKGRHFFSNDLLV